MNKGNKQLVEIEVSERSSIRQKENTYLLHNIRGWGGVYSYVHMRQQCMHLAEEINKIEPLVAAIEEFSLGYKMEHLAMLDKLTGEKYFIITPKGADIAHNYKAALSMLMIKKNYVENYETIRLHFDDDYSGLYNVVLVTLKTGEKELFINAHHVSLMNKGKPNWYQEKRRELSDSLWAKINTFITFYHYNKPDIKITYFADCNTDEQGSQKERLYELGSLLQDTVADGEKEKGTYFTAMGTSYRYDRIYSTEKERITTVYNDIICDWSDHLPVVMKISG